MTKEPIIQLAEPLIDLAHEREPTLVEVVTTPSFRRVAARALHDLEHQHDHGPWVVMCTATSELIAASPSFDPTGVLDISALLDSPLRLERDDAPLAVVGLGITQEIDEKDLASVAAEWVLRSLSDVAMAEQRAAIADARAGRAEALAATDSLTGLGNQRSWWARIGEEDARIERSHRSDVVAVIDLDGLKVVNDERGHLHGDLLLRLAAQTLRDTVRSCDVLARVGGDEFAVLAVDFDGDPSVLGERLARALEAAGIPASVGVACPDADTSLIDTFDLADRAMYAQKRLRQGTVPADA